MAEKKTYDVIIPIGGHITITVEAEDKDQAITAALEKRLSPEEIADAEWEMLDKVNNGNVCHFPLPWEVEAIEQ